MELTEETITRVITDALTIIVNKELWTQGAAARDTCGNEVEPSNPGAEKYSVRGAIAFALHCKQMDCSIGGHNVRAVSRELSRGLGIGAAMRCNEGGDTVYFDMLDTWNDDTDHATIIEAMTHVILVRGGRVPS